MASESGTYHTVINFIPEKPWYTLKKSDLDYKCNKLTGLRLSERQMHQIMQAYYTGFESLFKALGPIFKGDLVITQQCITKTLPETYSYYQYACQSATLIASDALLALFVTQAIGSNQTERLSMSPLEQVIMTVLADQFIETLTQIQPTGARMTSDTQWVQTQDQDKTPGVYILITGQFNQKIDFSCGVWLSLKTLTQCATALEPDDQTPQVSLNQGAMTALSLTLPAYLSQDIPISMTDLVGLDKGDIIPLTMALTDPVYLCIGDVAYPAILGQKNHNLAIQLAQTQDAAVPNTNATPAGAPVQDNHAQDEPDNSPAAPIVSTQEADESSFSWDDAGDSMISSLNAADTTGSFWSEEE